MQWPLLRPKCLQPSIRYLFLLLLYVLAVNAPALANDTKEPVGELSLDQALSLAMQAHPEIAVALREQEAIAGMKSQAAARLNPSVSTSMQDTRSATRETTLVINQEFELGNKRQARIEAAESFYSKATVELAHTKADIHANVVSAFYEVLAAQERLKLANASVEVAALARDAAAKRVKAGKSSPVEETKSKIAESSAKIELSQAASLLAASRKRLVTLWGNAAPVFEKVTGRVSHIPDIPAFNDLAAMLENAPAIKLAQQEIDAREAVTNIERSKSVPNITLSAGVVNNQELGINQAILGLSIPIPVFDRNQGNLQEAISRKYKAEDQLVALKSQLEANLATQHERLQAAKQAAESLKSEILPGAQSAFDAANKGFVAGKFNFLDVLDAQRTLFQGQAQYIQVLSEAHQAVAEIERILGDVISHSSNESQE